MALRSFVFGIVLALFALSATPALAAKAKPAKAPAKAASSSAAAHPVFGPDGSFGFCLFDRNDADGKKVTLALSPKEELNIGLTIPGGGFTPDARYDLTVSLGEGAARRIRAGALDEQTLLIQIGANPSFVSALKASTSLTAAASGHEILFALPPMSAAFDALHACLKTNQGKTNKAAAKAESLMPEPLKALLFAAGLKDIRPLNLEKIPVDQRPADFVWEEGPVLGGVRERELPESKSLAELTGLHLDGLKKKCPGTFKAEVSREDSQPGLKLRTADVSCQMKTDKGNETVMVALLFYITGAHRYTVFSHETPEPTKSQAQAARDAIKKVLIALAIKEAGEKTP